MNLSDKLKDIKGQAEDLAVDLTDKAGDLAGDVKVKTGEFARDHGDQVRSGVDRTTVFVEEKLGPKAGQVADRAGGAVKRVVDRLDPGDASSETLDGSS
jgi:hypothetical protein